MNHDVNDVTGGPSSRKGTNASGIGALKRLKPFVSLDTAKKIYDSLI